MNEEIKLVAGSMKRSEWDDKEDGINPWLEEEQDSPSRPIYGPWHHCWGMSPQEKEEWDWRHDLAYFEKIIKADRRLVPTREQREIISKEEYNVACAAWGLGSDCFKKWKKKKELQDYYND